MPKSKNNYGTFVTKRPWYFKRKPITVAGISATVLILTLSIAAALFNQKERANPFDIPKAEASEMPGWWLKDYFGSSVCDREDCKSEADPDDDKLTNAQEFYYHSNPLKKDTNGNGLSDGEMVAYGYGPSRPGKVTFEELITEDSFLGESLVFDKDIREMVAEANDINRVNLPLIKDEDLQIISIEDAAIYNAYGFGVTEIINKYFPPQNLPGVKQVLKSGSDYEFADLKFDSAMVVSELKSLPVPKELLMFHKYNIALFQLMPQVISVPADLSGRAGDIWYERAQAFLAVQQKLDFEYQRIKLLAK